MTTRKYKAEILHLAFMDIIWVILFPDYSQLNKVKTARIFIMSENMDENLKVTKTYLRKTKGWEIVWINNSLIMDGEPENGEPSTRKF